MMKLFFAIMAFAVSVMAAPPEAGMTIQSSVVKVYETKTALQYSLRGSNQLFELPKSHPQYKELSVILETARGSGAEMSFVFNKKDGTLLRAAPAGGRMRIPARM